MLPTLQPATLVWQASNLASANRHIMNVTVLTERNPASAGNKLGIHAYLAPK